MITSFDQAMEWLEANNRLLAISATTLASMKGPNFPPFYTDLFAYCRDHQFADNLPSYSARVTLLANMMRAFNKTRQYPTDAAATIDRQAYNHTLLYSFLFSINRYEILEFLTTQVRAFAQSTPRPSVAAIGIGTGYELKLVHDLLPDGRIDGFEIEVESIAFASHLLEYFGVLSQVDIHRYFPLAADDPVTRTYDLILMIELLEHLSDPEAALIKVRSSLNPNATLIATMAINIPQEDHIFHYRSIDECREQVARAGYTVTADWFSPAAISRFDEAQRNEFSSGNYMCVLHAR